MKVVSVVVLGAGGQLGGAFLRQLGPKAIGLGRAEADLTDPAGLEAALRKLHPAVVINAAAFNDVDRAERERATALAVNAHGPAVLARLARSLRFRLLHFSTDYVFGADARARPRRENDAPAPANFYGYTKLLGEQAVLANPEALVARVAHLFGANPPPGRSNLPLGFLARARTGQPITIPDGQYLTPTPAAAVARVCLALLERGARGLYHAAGAGWCPAAEFATEVLSAAGMTAEVRTIAADPRPARRARDTRLENSRLRQEKLEMPPWREGLREYLRQTGMTKR